MTDPLGLAMAEIQGVGYYWQAGPLKPVVRIYCAGCKGRGASQIGLLYPTRQGLCLHARRTREPLVSGERDSSAVLVHLLDRPVADSAGGNWVGHCRECGYRRLPPIETL